jgi:hypothetical protein
MAGKKKNVGAWVALSSQACIYGCRRRRLELRRNLALLIKDMTRSRKSPARTCMDTDLMYMKDISGRNESAMRNPLRYEHGDGNA